MEYIYAALLLHKGGKEINEENLKKVIESVGITSDEARIKTVIASLKGVDIEKVLKEAIVMPATQTTKTEAESEKKEEKKKEEAAEGLAALFG